MDKARLKVQASLSLLVIAHPVGLYEAVLLCITEGGWRRVEGTYRHGASLLHLLQFFTKILL